MSVLLIKVNLMVQMVVSLSIALITQSDYLNVVAKNAHQDNSQNQSLKENVFQLVMEVLVNQFYLALNILVDNSMVSVEVTLASQANS